MDRFVVDGDWDDFEKRKPTMVYLSSKKCAEQVLSQVESKFYVCCTRS